MGDNANLRALMGQAGYTNEALAREVNRIAAENGKLLRYQKGSVSHWLSGLYRPRAAVIGYIAEALGRRLGRAVHPIELGLTGDGDTLDRLLDDPIAALRSLGTAETNRRGLLVTSAYSIAALALPLERAQENTQRIQQEHHGRQIGQAEVDAVNDMLLAFDLADERLGGGHGRSALVEYLTTDVTALCEAPAAEEIRNQMLSSGCLLAYLAGWKFHDLQLEGWAQRYYLYACQLARAAGNTALYAYVMRIMAHQAYDLGHHQHCLDLAETSTALIRGKVDAHTEAVFTLTIARAHSMVGDRRRALDAINRAERLDDQSKDGDERPSWPKMRANHGQFHSHVAKSLMDLGDTSAAIRHFDLAYRERNPVTHTLISGLSQAWLAEAQFKAGRLEDAFANWAQARGRLTGVQSERANETQRDMRSMLKPLVRRNIPAVNRLLNGAA